MAGENPDDPQHRRATTSSCRRSKWQRFQILIVGPVMNLLLAVVLLAVVLDAGRRRARVSRISPAVIGAVQPGFAGGTAGHQARRRDHQVRHGRRRELGTPRHGGGGAARARSRSRSCCATAAKSDSGSVRTSPSCGPAATRGSRSATIGVLPDVYPQRRAAGRGQARGERRAQDRRRDPRDRRRAHGVHPARWSTRISKSPDTADRTVRVRRDGVEQTISRHAGAARARSAASASCIDAKTRTPFKPDAARSDRHERASATSRCAGLILQDAEGSRHRRSVAEAVDGTGRHRAALG